MKWPAGSSGKVAMHPISRGEVITVVAVILVLAAVFGPILTRHGAPAHRVDCAGNLKQIGLALLMYSGDNLGYFPTTAPNWGNDFGNVASKGHIAPEGKVWACPSATVKRTHVYDSNYIYIGSGIKDSNTKATGTTIAFDASGNHPGNAWMNAVFIDGHVEGSRPDGSKGWNLN